MGDDIDFFHSFSDSDNSQGLTICSLKDKEYETEGEDEQNKLQEQLTDEDFDLDRVLYNQFYWTRKQLFQEDLLDDGIVKVVTKLVEIFGKSKISTPFHEDGEYFDLILDDCDGVRYKIKLNFLFFL
jgi:hypothetical protein